MPNRNPPPASPSGAIPPTPMSLSPNGLAFIERHEGFSAAIYPDSAGYPTIGYGHLIKPGEDFSHGITRAQASLLLAQDTSIAADAVNDKVTINLTQFQFDALVDFTYNLGAGALKRSRLLKNLNSRIPVALKNFADWNRAAGKVVPGLTRRRIEEFNLFSKGEYGA
jgi:lysozyme